MMLENGFQGFFRKDRLCITDDNKAVRDLDTGIIYGHHFSVRPKLVPVTQEMVSQGFERQRAMLSLLGKFWMRGIQTTETLVVRQSCRSCDEALELYEVLKRQAAPLQCGLLVVSAPGQQIEIDHCGIHVERGPEIVVSEDEWMGDDAAWNCILQKYWCGSSG